MVVWYRAVERKHYTGGGVEVDGSYSASYFSHATVEFEEFEVVKVTPKGVRIRDHRYWRDRFVRLEATKRFACPTKEEALVSFRARKLRQLSILRSQARVIESAMRSLDKKPVGDYFS